MKENLKYTLLGLLLSNSLISQDNNYWNFMPGSRTSLLGGIVIAGVKDNSSIFYNPGAFVLVDSNTIDISTNYFQYENVNVFNGGGRGINYNSSNIQNIPSISFCERFHGKFFKKHPKNAIGIMLFTKLQSSNNFSKRTEMAIDKADVFHPSTNYLSSVNTVNYIGDFNLQTSVNEQVAALSYSRYINKFISVGMTPMFAYRSQKYNNSFVSRVMLDPYSNFGQCSILSLGYNDVSTINFSNLRFLTKFGVLFSLRKIKVGVTFTSASVNITGSSLIARDISYNGGQSEPDFKISSIPMVQNGNAAYPIMYNLNDRQNKVKTAFKSPNSIAFGIEYQISNTTFLIGSEYFWAISPYNLATPSDATFYRSGLIYLESKNNTLKGANSSEYLKITEGNKSVINIGLAVEQRLSKKWKLLASFRTDNSSYQKVSNNFWQYYYGEGDNSFLVSQKISITNINIYHFSLGASYRKSNSDLHIGIFHSYGYSSDFEPFNNIAEPTDNIINNNLGSTANYSLPAAYSYNSFSLLLGYTHYIK